MDGAELHEDQNPQIPGSQTVEEGMDDDSKNSVDSLTSPSDWPVDVLGEENKDLVEGTAEDNQSKANVESDSQNDKEETTTLTSPVNVPVNSVADKASVRNVTPVLDRDNSSPTSQKFPVLPPRKAQLGSVPTTGNKEEKHQHFDAKRQVIKSNYTYYPNRSLHKLTTITVRNRYYTN